MRARTHSLPADSSYGAVGFLPTTLPADNAMPFAVSRSNTPTTAVGPGKGGQAPRPAYGLFSPARDAVLGLPDAARLVARAYAELERTGVATPFVFCALALDIRRPPSRASYTSSCLDPSSSNSNDAHQVNKRRSAGAHELEIYLQWGADELVRSFLCLSPFFSPSSGPSIDVHASIPLSARYHHSPFFSSLSSPFLQFYCGAGFDCGPTAIHVPLSICGMALFPAHSISSASLFPLLFSDTRIPQRCSPGARSIRHFMRRTFEPVLPTRLAISCEPRQLFFWNCAGRGPLFCEGLPVVEFSS
ncbi:hypothetical protein C8R44DRAFT_886010 [Mycena epipterygia]|nr:hypothetical protein C8R44DRAFT_886010 [Mycena epipterygia]